MICLSGGCCSGWCGWLSLNPPAVHSGPLIYHSQLLLIFTNVWQTSAESEKPSPFFPSQLPFFPAGCWGRQVSHILYRTGASHSLLMCSCSGTGWGGLKAACPASLVTRGHTGGSHRVPLPPCPRGIHLSCLPVPIRAAVVLWCGVPVCTGHAVLMLLMASLTGDIFTLYKLRLTYAAQRYLC